MKLWVSFAIFVWLLCGFIGAWWMNGLDDVHWKAIARGPLTLAKAYNDKPVNYPGPN